VCFVLQCVAVYFIVLQCVEVCCSVLRMLQGLDSQSFADLFLSTDLFGIILCVLQCVAVCCSVLRCVAVRHSDSSVNS